MDFKEIERFAAEVRAALSHLSVEQIAHLTEGLEANVQASVDDGRGLPDVETYVKELLSGAGLDIEKSAGTHGVFRWIRAFINATVNWFRGLNSLLRLLVGIVAFIALTVFTTDNWTVAVVVVAVILISVSRVPLPEARQRNKSIAVGLAISFAVLGWALVSGEDQNYDPYDSAKTYCPNDSNAVGLVVSCAVFGVALVIADADSNYVPYGSVKTYCPGDSNLEERIAFPTKDVPNLVGKTWDVATAEARLWWAGGVELEAVNPEVFQGTGVSMTEGLFIVSQQGDPVLIHTICDSRALIPVVLDPRGSTVTTLTPEEFPGDTTTSVLPSDDNGGSSSTTSSSVPKSKTPSASTTTTTRS